MSLNQKDKSYLTKTAVEVLKSSVKDTTSARELLTKVDNLNHNCFAAFGFRPITENILKEHFAA